MLAHTHLVSVLAAAAESPAAAGVGPVRAAVVTVLLVVGSFFLFVGTFGLLRLPTVYNRMHATSKAATLGASSMLLAGGVYFGPAAQGLTSLVGIVFLFVTVPTGAHMISRSARRMGIPFVEDARWPALGEGIPGAPGDVASSEGDDAGDGDDPDTAADGGPAAADGATGDADVDGGPGDSG